MTTVKSHFIRLVTCAVYVVAIMAALPAVAGLNLVPNGDFEFSSCYDDKTSSGVVWGGYHVSTFKGFDFGDYWGAGSTYINPNWQIATSGTGAAAIAMANSTWMAPTDGVYPDVGKWCAVLQAKAVGDKVTWANDFYIPAAGSYLVSFKYAARRNYSGSDYGKSRLKLSASFGGAGIADEVGIADEIDVSAIALSSVSKTVEVDAPGMYRIEFYAVETGSTNKDMGMVVDDVRVERTDGDGETRKEFVINGDFDQYRTSPGTENEGNWGYTYHSGFLLPGWAYFTPSQLIVAENSNLRPMGQGLAIDNGTWLNEQTNGGTYSYFAQVKDAFLAQNLGTIPRGIYEFSYNIASRKPEHDESQMQVRLCADSSDLINFTTPEITNLEFERFSTIVAFGDAVPDVDVRFMHKPSTDQAVVLDDISFSCASVDGWGMTYDGTVTLSEEVKIPAYARVVGDVAISPGATLVCALGTDGAVFDVGGGISASGSIAINLSNTDNIVPGTYSLISAGSADDNGAAFSVAPATANGCKLSANLTSEGLVLVAEMSDYYWTGADGDMELSTLGNWSTSSSEAVIPTEIGEGSILIFTNDSDLVVKNTLGTEVKGVVKTGSGKLTLTDFTAKGGKTLSLTEGSLALAWTGTKCANPFAVDTAGISAALDIGGATQTFSGSKREFFRNGCELVNGKYNFTNTEIENLASNSGAVFGENAVFSIQNLESRDEINVSIVINGGVVTNTYVNGYNTAMAVGRIDKNSASDVRVVVTNGGILASRKMQVSCTGGSSSIYIDNGKLSCTDAYNSDFTMSFLNSSTAGKADFALVNGSYLYAESILIGKNADSSLVGRFGITNSTIKTQQIKVQDDKGNVAGEAFDLSVVFNGATIVPSAENTLINDHGLYAGRAAAFRCDGGGLRIENDVGTCYLDVKMDGKGPFTVAGSGTIYARSTQPFGLGALTVTDTSVLKFGTNIVAGEVTVQSGATLDFSDITADGFAASKFNSLTMQEGSKLKVSGELPDDGNIKKIALLEGCSGLDLSKVTLDVSELGNSSSGTTHSYLRLEGGTLYLRRANCPLVIIAR